VAESGVPDYDRPTFRSDDAMIPNEPKITPELVAQHGL